MRLLRLHVENFGTLRDYRMDFGDALNVLHEENGWGKTTLAVFIKAMLYGLPATTKRSLDENERKKYTPWQGGAFGGSLEFSCGAGDFRIERFFGAKEAEDSFALYDLRTNMESRTFTANVGEELFGIDADAFERTVYLSQRTAPKGDSSSIAARLGNLLDDVDDIGSYDDAIAALEKRRKHYVLSGGRGRVADLERELLEVRTELEELKRERDTLNAREAEALQKSEHIARVSQELQGVRAAVLRASHTEQKNRMLEELRALDERKKALEQMLHGQHPSDGALEEQRELLRQLQGARARLEAISDKPITPERTRLLTAQAYASSPKEEMLPKLERANGEWRDLCGEEALLRASMGASRRFERGVPTDEELAAARRVLESTQKNADDAPAKARTSLAFAWALRIAGVCCTALGILFLPALIVGIVLLIASAIELAVSCVRTARRSKENEARAAAEAARRQNALQSVRTLLRRYGVQDADPTRGLDELSYLVRAYREELDAARESKTRLAEIGERKKQVISFLRTGFRLYGVELNEKNDYRDEAEALKQDVACFARAVRDEGTRRRARAEAESRCRELKERMRPFLELYDPEKKYAVSELLRLVDSREQEYRRVCADTARKSRELSAFIREKGLDAGEVHESERALREREQSLQGALTRWQREHSTLLSQIENLSQRVDLIPEVEARIVALSEELEEARVNSRTVELTKQYLETAKTALSTRYLDDMQTSFEHFLAILTEGAPPESVMDASFDVSLRAAGKTRSMESFSRGWRDAVQFCVRLSLADALCRDGERPFLLLDDPFVNLDDDRLAAAKRLLTVLSERYQILHMVCHADRG